MANVHNTMKCVALMIMAAALSGALVLAYPKPVDAQRAGGSSYSRGGGSYQPSYPRGGGSYQPSYTRGGGSYQSSYPRGGGSYQSPYTRGEGSYHSSYTYGGGRYYPYYPYRGGRYYPYHYYWGGGYYPYCSYAAWGYYPWWPWFYVAPSLPLYYQTVWVGGVPYYYANGNYYAETAGGYVIVDPPQGTDSQESSPLASAPSGDRLFVYPRQGQSEKQQAEDRYQCHRWAVDQTGYDPTIVSGSAPSVRKRGDYQRAMIACLDARGYTAK